LHQLAKDKTIFACQNPAAIAQGVFHNDVISLANESLFLLHEVAFENQPQLLKELRKKAKFPLQIIEVASAQLSLKEVVDSYLFNSQLVTLPEKNEMHLIAAIECKEQPKVKAYLEELINQEDNPICRIHYLDLRESMHNGGGPACGRLRVPLKAKELAAMHQGVLLTDALFERLDAWILKHYRDQILPSDLADPQLLLDSFSALDELTQILNLGSIYPFQCV
jgi:succinylarginine dihydrolase